MGKVNSPKEALMGKVLWSATAGLCLMFVSLVSSADMGKGAMPLRAMAGSKAEQHITEGIEHYGKGHWDVAKKHFTEAAKADPESAEAHYDVALVLDKMGDHGGATEHFKKAYELGKSNPQIQDSDILKKHLKM
jgi:Tfp pilus assembly protein PilF